MLKKKIDADDIQRYADVDNALTQFYRDSLAVARQTRVRERDLRRWFGDRLITPVGTRGLVYYGATATEGLANAAVDALQKWYIIHPVPAARIPGTSWRTIAWFLPSARTTWCGALPTATLWPTPCRRARIAS